VKKLRIVFMGTPRFAVPMLDTLVNSTHEVVGVVTAPDKPAGRGMKLSESDVKIYAKQKGLHILQPEKLKNEQFLNELRALNADLFVVVAFRMLPEVVWRMPPLGTINLHASLLPQYRGAAPINWAIINGEKETGVTTFFIQQEIDTGKIIFSDKVTIREDENVGELYNELMNIGAKTLRKTVDAIAEGNYPQIPQDHIKDVKHAPKIFKEHCKIDWNKSAEEIYNLIRGLSPYPAAFTIVNDKIFKIYRAEKHNTVHNKRIGSYETDGKTYVYFYCNNGYLSVLECQLEGKKRMSIEELLRGYQFS
jgi:methionyl-tRNA formyltransferase